MSRTVTAITAQKRNPQRVSIYLDGEFAFGLARIVAAWLSVGEVLEEERIQALQRDDELEVAYQQALHFISYRVRTTQEVSRKLTEKGFSESTVSQTVDRLRENHLLDDAQFAQLWVENRANFSPRSLRVLAYELRQKGVAEEDIQGALPEAEDEEALAYQAAQRQARRYQGLDRTEFRNRLGAFLARRGFGYGTIAPVVDRLWQESQSSEADSDT